MTCVRPGGAWTNFSDGWDEESLRGGIEAWQKVGSTMDIGMEVDHVAAAVVNALSYPAGVAVDLIELRPNQPMQKMAFE